MSKVRLGIWSDAVIPTGFSRVMHSIVQYLPKKDYDVSWLGINYRGDPHPFDYKIYPAAIAGNIWGINRLNEFLDREKPQILFLLNDIWMINKVLEELKDRKDLPKIVTYFPVDSTNFDESWFSHFGLVTKIVTYTNFGKEVVHLAKPTMETEIIPHGMDHSVFYKIDKAEAKRKVYPDREDLQNSFIFFNGNRNQPRKRIDIFLEAFALFSKDKPENVKAYCHMGLRDAGWDIIRLARRFGIENRLIISNNNLGIQTVTDERLNLIYNATDVGVNTGIGEGWGLVNTEHACTGAPQIVGKHSACIDLFDDCGITVPVNMWLTNTDTLTVSGYSKQEDFAAAFEQIYSDKELYNKLSEATLNKFTSDEYKWSTVSKQWDILFKGIS